VCPSGGTIIKGYDFRAVGGHQSTVLRISSAACVDIEENEFDNDANTYGSSNLNDYAIFLAAANATYPITFAHNTVNGECNGLSCTYPNFQVVNYTSGETDWLYNAFLMMPIRITAGCGASTSVNCPVQGDMNFEWNFYQGPTASTSVSHGELMIFLMSQKLNVFSTMNYMRYIGNVDTVPSTAGPWNTTNIYISGGGNPVGPPTINHVIVSDSTLIANSNGASNTGDALIDFQNMTLPDVQLLRLATDVTGSRGHQFRGDCDQQMFTGSIASDGTVSIAGLSSGIVQQSEDVGASQLYYGGAASGFHLTGQFTSNETTREFMSGVTISGTVLTYTTSVDGSGNPIVPQHTDLVVGPGVPDGTMLVSSAGGNSWNINQSVNIASPISAEGKPCCRTGTYSSTATGAVSSQAMVAYQAFGTATFPNSATISGVFDMINGSSVTTFNEKNACFVFTPP
jgi:hypothetical protein